MVKMCKACVWYGQCMTYVECDDFTPYEPDLDALIEEARVEYHEEWDEYVNEMAE